MKIYDCQTRAVEKDLPFWVGAYICIRDGLIFSENNNIINHSPGTIISLNSTFFCVYVLSR